MAAEILVISKKDLTKHETISVNLSLPPLAPSSIRARSTLIAITSNNLSYAKLGDMLHWWSTWPVPLDGPAPYNNRDEWGIVPAWGFARVLESNIEAIPSGSLVYGYWPTSSHEVDLNLVPHEPKGHFREVSDHRKELGSIYNRYNLFDESSKPEDFRAIFANAYPIWNAGYVLNRFSFPTEFKGVHPTGQYGGEWTDKDGDLSSAVVVNLSASSRTGRSITWNFARNRKPATNGPLAWLNVTSSPQYLSPSPEAAFEIKNVKYDELAVKETVDWIASVQPKRIVVFDNGGPVEVTEQLREALVAKLPEGTSFTLVLIGGEPKMQSPEEFQALMGLRGKWGVPVQLNTTWVIDDGVEAEGAESFFRNNEAAFEKAVGEKYLGNMELVWGTGVGGSSGVEKAWENIIQGTLTPNRAWVYRLGN
ncbi:hypothetical protein CGLO_17884 [Colletotrichum gloeosporioides Cg-14]|uniref:Uncharacterized protein n=1 Tax=Colletotrichum gloeosporioides (strain Cg-14) TaxID=1237896 RepID=T0JVS5_COLGC|nr:hypothetical protein CGLO_17884 [Colletotrichum gloeosporioides Cg-14]